MPAWIREPIDGYLDHAMYISALWLKWMFDVGMMEPFEAVLDDREMEIVIDYFPRLSPDLQEFDIGVEGGSTRKSRDLETIAQMDKFFETLPLLQQMLAQGGKTFKLDSVVKRYIRALETMGDPQEIIVDIPEQGMGGGLEPPGIGFEGMGAPEVGEVPPEMAGMFGGMGAG